MSKNRAKTYNLIKKDIFGQHIKKITSICLTFHFKYVILIFVVMRDLMSAGEYMGFIKSNAIVGQSGGPTAAINATLAGIIRGARGRAGKLYGMKNGIWGLLEKRVVELNSLFYDEEGLSLLERTPSVALGSCRFKLPNDLHSPIYGQIFVHFSNM